VVEVTPYSTDWPVQFDRVACDLAAALKNLPEFAVEHVGSTSVPGLPAKPVIDIDIIVPPSDVAAAVAALVSINYVHRGDLGVIGREALKAPDNDPRRHVYVCAAGTLNLRNHLAVRDVLRSREDLRDEYAAVKLALAADPEMDIDSYIAGKSEALQRVLAASDLTEDERHQIWRLNDPSVTVMDKPG